jgi:hypothetical protein
MTQVTRKTVMKQQDELAKLLAQKAELEARINPLWQALRMSRLVAIRADIDPGQLPQLLGLDPMERVSQERREATERANHQIDVSAEHQAGLRQIADLSSAA